MVDDKKAQKMAGFLVLLTDDADAAEKQLADFAAKHQIKNIPLTVYDGVAGPPSYHISEDAEVTVNLWVSQEAKANHAFRKGELTEEQIAKVIGDTSKILE